MKDAPLASARFPARRRLLQHLAVIAAAGLSGTRHETHAAEPPQVQQGIRRMRGAVMVDGVAARIGTVIAPGATVTTGPKAEAAYVIGDDAFLQRADTHVQAEIGAATIFRVITGALMSVFARGVPKTIRTPVVTAGIRGTGCYVHVEARRTYFCLCYGAVELTPTGGQPRSYSSKHHDQPFWIVDGRITTGEMVGHSDTELQYLESLVARTVPFRVPYAR